MTVSAYTAINWDSTTTPLNPTNLNKMDGQIKAISDQLTDSSQNFQTPTLLNSWVANSGSYPPRFWKDSAGVVHYEFALMNGGTSTNTVVLNFPVGYRPANSIFQVAFGDTPTSALQPMLYHVASNGELKFIRTYGACSFAVFNGSFKAVN